MSNSTGGFHYRSDLRKSLPQDIRDTILTRFSGGGTLDASAPSNRMPRRLEVTLRHPKDQTSSFSVLTEAAADVDAASGKLPDEEWLTKWYRAFSNPLILAAAAVAILLILLAVILLARQRRKRDESSLQLTPAPLATVDEVRENLSAQREAIGLAEPIIPPAIPKPPEPVQKPDLAKPEPAVAPDAPVIAWLEFNSAPGRVAVRKKHVTIGREDDNDVITDPKEDTVSRHHAAISINTNGRFQISNRSREYRHTPNPISVNDKEMEHSELSDGDRVKLGTGSYGFVFVEIH
jgi:hypothetical protein